MVPHKKILSTAFTVGGLYYAYTVVRDFDSILATQCAFFDLAPAWQANVTTAVIALTPLAFLAVALAVYRDAKWWVAAVPALIAIVFTTGISSIVLGAYLALYYVLSARQEDLNSIEA